ncbi:hypothetical protein [Thermogladius calderae]|uniref:hypothetical protein n=1 Tax=Thermogladius calderae TaxID=1200300 RepID=UPI0012FF1743|nr:hypothetical protein [Thermogladius calderae]
MFERLPGRPGGVGAAPSLGGLPLDGGPPSLNSTVAREPAGVSKTLWTRRRTLEGTINSILGASGVSRHVSQG